MVEEVEEEEEEEDEDEEGERWDGRGEILKRDRYASLSRALFLLQCSLRLLRSPPSPPSPFPPISSSFPTPALIYSTARFIPWAHPSAAQWTRTYIE